MKTIENKTNGLRKDQKIAQKATPVSINQKDIENHRTAATHLEAAAKNHLNAAKYHEEGSHEKAAQCTVVAQGHVSLANKAQRKDAQQHATRS
jgi:hypothetical protein